MDLETTVIARRKFNQAQQALENNDVLSALACMEVATRLWDNPAWYSCLGFCIASQRGQLTRAFELCSTAIEHDPEHPLHYLYLGKVYLLAGKKNEALQAFRKCKDFGGSPELERILVSFGVRNSPVIRFLAREHPLNKLLGIIRCRFDLRKARNNEHARQHNFSV